MPELSKIQKFYLIWLLAFVGCAALIVLLNVLINLLFSPEARSWGFPGFAAGIAPSVAERFVRDPAQKMNVICEPALTKHFLLALFLGAVLVFTLS
jgi:hypothetical protein